MDLEAIRKAGHTLTYECHGAAADWWKDIHTGEHFSMWSIERQRAFVAEKLLLIHSELSEAVEGRRKGINDDKLTDLPMFDVELADTAIRLFDLCGALGINIGWIMGRKMLYNAGRADHKVEQRRAEGGKKS